LASSKKEEITTIIAFIANDYSRYCFINEIEPQQFTIKLLFKVSVSDLKSLIITIAFTEM
jgi:hypothetical protein